MDIDLDHEFADIIENYEDLIEDVSNGGFCSIDLNGYASLWVIFKVINATDDTYAMSVDFAGRLSTDLSILATIPMPKAGTYSWSEDIAEQMMTMKVNAILDTEILVDATVFIDRSTMGIKSLEINSLLDGDFVLKVESITTQEQNWTSQTTTFGYADYDITADLSLNLSMGLEISPSLDIWGFPINIGDEWDAETIINTNCELSGRLNVEGIPDNMKEDIFSNELVEQIGFDDFPIIFEEMNGDTFDGGVMEETTENVITGLKCTNAFFAADDYWGK